MITSKQVIKLSEDWFKDVKNGNITASIFVNPGSSDIRDIYKNAVSANRAGHPTIRFIADAKTHKVYVWDAYYAYHDDVATELGYVKPNEYLDEPPFVYDGYGKIVNGKIVGNDTHGTTSNIDSLLNSIETNHYLSDRQIKERIDILSPIFTYNWSFIDRYISGFTKFIQDRQQRFFILLSKLNLNLLVV